MREFCHAQVESRIVDQDQHIGMKVKNILFAGTKIPENHREVGNHFGKAHKGEVAVMPDHLHPLLFHQIAAPATEVTRWIQNLQFPYQGGGMEIARGFTGDEIIAHQKRSARE